MLPSLLQLTTIKVKLTKQVPAICQRICNDIYEYRFPILLVIIYFILANHFYHEICPFVILTGFPCAGCGLTRAFLYLCTGDFAKALDMNLSILAWVAFMIWFVIRRYIQGKELRYFTAIITLVGMITLMYYIYRMVVIFPLKEPMVYQNNNILSNYIKLLRSSKG